MKDELMVKTYDIDSIVFSDRTAYDQGVLSIREGELKALLLEDEDIGSVVLGIARPGDSARIVHLYDVIEPRTKVEGPGGVFSGWLAPPSGNAIGTIHRLSRAAVITCTELSSEGDEYTEQGEGVVDMSGPIAEMTPFSQTVNVVVEVKAKRKLTIDEYTKAVTRAGLKTAKYLADTTVQKIPSGTEVLPGRFTINPDLPNIVLILVVAGTSPTLDTYVYGRSCIGMVPTLVHPNEMAEGALVAFSSMASSSANKTYYYQKNPLIENLHSHHGTRHNFVGVIIQRGYSYEYNDKERIASHSANLARFLKANGAIITSEGGGHILIDTMLACRECEERGIKTAVVMIEQTGKDGTGSPWTDFVPEANLVVSVGNVDEFVHLRPVKTAYGGKKYLKTEIAANAANDVRIKDICCVNSMLGAARVRSVYEDRK
jgi:glycine reductase